MLCFFSTQYLKVIKKKGWALFMRFWILFIVKEDDGSILRADNKKIVSFLHIPRAIILSTRTFLKLENARCSFAVLFCYNFYSVEVLELALWAFELSPKNSSCGWKTAAYPEAYCKSLTHVTGRALPLSSKNRLWSLTFFLKSRKKGGVKNCEILLKIKRGLGTAAMAEWLRREIRNLLGSPRAGSNPVRSELFGIAWINPCG